MNIIQRLHTQTVAGDEKLLLSCIPDRKCKHSAQIFNAIAAVFFVQMQDRLGIAAILKFVAIRDQAFSMVGMVVNLAVVDDSYRAVRN